MLADVSRAVASDNGTIVDMMNGSHGKTHHPAWLVATIVCVSVFAAVALVVCDPSLTL